MKSALRSAFVSAGRIEPVWQLFKGLNFVSRCLAEPFHHAGVARMNALDAEVARRISPSLMVLNGPFAGMRYPAAESAGSALVPKIIGSYERELHPILAGLLDAEFSDVVDIGCAEGWYAVGLARCWPTVRVHAFDTDLRAQLLCRSMAAANGVGDRVNVGGLCDAGTLLRLPLGPRALIISDCEGYEAELFSYSVAQHLRAHDLLIEVHDRDKPELGLQLRSMFSATHRCTVIDSVDDTRKLRSYHFPELAGFDALQRRRLLSEGRGMVMEWLHLTPIRREEALPVAGPATAAS